MLCQTDSKSMSFTRVTSHVKHLVTACWYKTARTTSDAELLQNEQVSLAVLFYCVNE